MASASAGSGNPGQAVTAPAPMPRRLVGERSSAFSLTCSRLSQYLKEKGTLGGIGLEMARTFDGAAKGTGKQEPPRTMNLLPGIDSNPDAPTKLTTPPTEQQLLPAAAPTPAPQIPRGAQMTIFYGGKVIVFDNYPADKAKELLAIAGRSVTGTPTPKTQVSSPVIPPIRAAAAAAAAATTVPLPVPVKPPPTAVVATPPPADVLPAAAAAAAAAPVVLPIVAAPATPAAVPQDRTQKPPVASDLPIARRVSLNRFLEKRKDRISAKAPYPLNAVASSSDGSPLSDKEKPKQPVMPPVPEKQTPQQQQQHQWLGLAPSDSR